MKNKRGRRKIAQNFCNCKKEPNAAKVEAKKRE